MKSHEVEFSPMVIGDAREKYLADNLKPPKQLNIQFSESEGWDCEFADCEGDGNLEEFTLWMSGEDVLKVFFSLDPDLLGLDAWEESYNDE